MKRAVCIKFGGSVITDKSQPFTERPETIKQLCKEFAACYERYPDTVWFLGNGAGSYGHYVVHDTQWREHPDDMLATAKVRQATARLNLLIVTELIAVGVPVIALPPAAYLVGAGGTQLSINADTMGSWAAMGAVPIVYGDLISTGTNAAQLVPTESLLFEAAKQWSEAGGIVEKTIYCTAVDGVLDEKGKAIEYLKPDILVGMTQNTNEYDVSGGMRQKVDAGFKALEYSQQVHIINGFTPGALSAVLRNEPTGTELLKV